MQLQAANIPIVITGACGAYSQPLVQLIDRISFDGEGGGGLLMKQFEIPVLKVRFLLSVLVYGLWGWALFAHVWGLCARLCGRAWKKKPGENQREPSVNLRWCSAAPGVHSEYYDWRDHFGPVQKGVGQFPQQSHISPPTLYGSGSPLTQLSSNPPSSFSFPPAPLL